MIVVGCDPDAAGNYYAFYEDGKLTRLCQLQLIELIGELERHQPGQLFFSIENVLANNFVYSRNRKANRAQEVQVARSVGRNQQAQMELMRVLDYMAIPYEVVKPQRGNWADNKPQFEKLTGWSGRSNADQRSSAFFGFLAASRGNAWVEKKIQQAAIEGVL